jgi:hypothetical protein
MLGLAAPYRPSPDFQAFYALNAPPPTVRRPCHQSIPRFLVPRRRVTHWPPSAMGRQNPQAGGCCRSGTCQILPSGTRECGLRWRSGRGGVTRAGRRRQQRPSSRRPPPPRRIRRVCPRRLTSTASFGEEVASIAAPCNAGARRPGHGTREGTNERRAHRRQALAACAARAPARVRRGLRKSFRPFLTLLPRRSRKPAGLPESDFGQAPSCSPSPVPGHSLPAIIAHLLKITSGGRAAPTQALAGPAHTHVRQPHANPTPQPRTGLAAAMLPGEELKKGAWLPEEVRRGRAVPSARLDRQ